MQHLNFYRQLEREVEPPFSARQQLRLFAVAAVAMLAIYLILQIGVSRDGGELKQLTSQQNAVAEQLKQLRTKKANLENNPELDQDIADLQLDLEFRHRLMGTIKPDGGTTKSGFAEYLSGLARQHIDGMWFTEIQLRHGGQQMALLGETKEPEYVPRYLQKLAQEPVFAGQSFRVLRMHVPAQRKDLHVFELRANEVGTP